MKFSITLSLITFLILIACGKGNSENGIADFTYTKECAGGTPCTVQFINKSTGDATFIWDFGDKTAYSNERNPSHLYKDGTTFTVTLTAQYANTKKIFKQTINLSALGACETKGTFSCAKRLLSGLQVQDRMNSTRNNYYYLQIDTPGVIQIEVNAVPGASTDHYFEVSLLSSASSDAEVIEYGTGKGGEAISFYAGPLEKKEYYIRVKEQYFGDTTQTFNLGYKFINTDLNEPNATFATATPLPFSKTIAGTILAGNDVDFFKYYQTTPGTVDVTINPVPDFGQNNYLNVYAYRLANTSSNSAWRSWYAYSGEMMQMSIGPLDTGYHYIQLTAGSSYESPQQYHITATFDTSDLHEPNSTFFEATQVPLDQAIRGTIKARNDRDYYKFTAIAEKPVTITIPVVPEGLGYMYIELYEAASSDTEMGNKYSNANDFLEYTSSQTLQAGKTYYILLYSGSGTESNRQYTMTIKQ